MRWGRRLGSEGKSEGMPTKALMLPLLYPFMRLILGALWRGPKAFLSTIHFGSIIVTLLVKELKCIRSTQTQDFVVYFQKCIYIPSTASIHCVACSTSSKMC